MFDLTSNIVDVSVRFRKAGSQVTAFAEASLDRAAAVVWQQSIKRLLRIYARPIPTRAQVAIYNVNFKNVGKNKIGQATKGVSGNGNLPAWKRTGNLMAGETTPTKGPLTRLLSTVNAAAPYAQARHQLGITRIAVRPALGIQRINPWRDEAIKITQPQVGKVFEQEFRNQVRNAGV